MRLVGYARTSKSKDNGRVSDDVPLSVRLPPTSRWEADAASRGSMTSYMPAKS